MQVDEFLDCIDSLMVPAEYRSRITDKVPAGWRVYCKGSYVFAAVPYMSVPAGDYRNRFVKNQIRKLMLAIPFFWEKGLFLLYYGPVAKWEPYKKRHEVDKTALRPVI